MDGQIHHGSSALVLRYFNLIRFYINLIIIDLTGAKHGRKRNN